MSFTKVTPQKNPKQRQNQTTGYDFPLRTSLVVKSNYQNDINLALESEREIADTSQYQRHLYVDGLCQNTIENLDNSAVDEEKIEARQRRVLSCSVVLMFVVCAVSLISLVLTLLMLTGNISPRCSCASSKGLDRSKSMQASGFSLTGGKQEAENGFQRWLIDVLRNMTEKMDDQSRDFHKLKDDFSIMNENREKNEKELQESVKETKNELDSKIRAMKAAMTHVDISLITLNTTSEEMNKVIDKLRQDLGDTKKNLRLKTLDVSVLYKNLTRLQNQSKQECRKNYSKTQTKLQKAELNLVTTMTRLTDTTDKFNKTINKMQRELYGVNNEINEMDSNVNKLQTKLNQTAASFHKSFTRQQEKLKEVSKTANYKLNLTKDEINSSLQEISSDLLEMKTYFTKQVNNTKRSIEASSSVLQNSIKDLNETLLNKIRNMTTTSSPIGSNTGNNGSVGLPGITSPPGINAANFSQCQYKVVASAGTANTGDPKRIYVDADLQELKGKRIVGSTCSTNGAAEYNLIKLTITGINTYRCTCRGVSNLFVISSGNKIHCYLHYWECPFVD